MTKEIAKIFLVASFLITISSCDRRNCQNVSCPVGQNCANGQCYCTDGYEGADCNTESYLKYVTGSTGGSGVKSWNVTETCYSGSSNFPGYTAFITHNSTVPREIEINNFLGNGTVYATIRTDQSNKGNIVEINSQSCGGIMVSGQGIWDVNYNRITFQLNYTYNFNSYQCTHTFY